MMRQSTTALFAAAFLTACAATEEMKERAVFLRSPITPQAYMCDITSCDGYAKTNNASGGEQAGAVAAGLLLGGIVGAASINSSYEKSRNRLFEECMFLKGYRLVNLPDGYGTDPRTDADDFDHRQAEFDLVQQGKVNELVAWENAKNFGGRTRLSSYLSDHPNGYFVADARRRLAGNEVPVNARQSTVTDTARPHAGENPGASTSSSGSPLSEALSNVKCETTVFELPAEPPTRRAQASKVRVKTPASAESSDYGANPVVTSTAVQRKPAAEPPKTDVALATPKRMDPASVTGEDREAMKIAIEDYYYKGGYDEDVLESEHDSFYGMQMDDIRRLTIQSIVGDRFEVVAEYTASATSRAGSVGLERRSNFLLRKRAGSFTVLKMWGATPI